MREHLISADDNGNLVFIYNDELAFLGELGTMTTARASHVEPGPDGKWYADMSPAGGPVLTGTDLRQTALDSEVEWLKENVL